jgi:hypothetical protein
LKPGIFPPESARATGAATKMERAPLGVVTPADGNARHADVRAFIRTANEMRSPSNTNVFVCDLLEPAAAMTAPGEAAADQRPMEADRSASNGAGAAGTGAGGSIGHDRTPAVETALHEEQESPPEAPPSWLPAMPTGVAAIGAVLAAASVATVVAAILPPPVGSTVGLLQAVPNWDVRDATGKPVLPLRYRFAYS